MSPKASVSFSYIIIYSTVGSFRSYLVPDDEILSEDRLALEELQIFGSLDAPEFARQDKQRKIRQMCINLYTFEFQKTNNGREHDEIYIEACKYRYEKLNSKEFTGFRKWQQYKRTSNIQTQFDNRISHIYEFIDNTFESES